MDELHAGEDGRAFEQLVQRRLHARVGGLGNGRVGGLRKAIGAEGVLVKADQGVASRVPAHRAEAADGGNGLHGHGRLPGDQAEAPCLVLRRRELDAVRLPPFDQPRKFEDVRAIHPEGHAVAGLDLLALHFAAHGFQCLRVAQGRQARTQRRKRARAVFEDFLEIVALGARRFGHDDAGLFHQRVAAAGAVGKAADVRRGIGAAV